MIKLSDYVIDFLVQKGVRDVFLVSGGGIMHLIDSVGKNKKINYIANHHEQASATAAESYSRLTNDIGVCLVTTGPGGTNAITGVAGAWVDSIPMIVISGQVKRELIADYKKVRQVGPQEINIVGMVKGITKYAKTIMDPDTIKYELEKAYFEAKNGRPGPVWLDIPLDVQAAMVDEKKMVGFSIPKIKKNEKELNKKIDKVIELLKKSKRPVIIAGNGIRLSGGVDVFKKLVEKIKIPVLLPINGLDLLDEDNPFLLGKFGPFGQRRGNFVLQNSDLVISIGASLNISSTGFDYKNFAPMAKKVYVNIDKGENSKKINFDTIINGDARDVMEIFLERYKENDFSEWLMKCNLFKKKYTSIEPFMWKDKDHVNSYIFFNILSDFLRNDDVLITGIGLDACGMYQAYEVKKNQRAYVNKNFGQMGWDLPAAIGACVANKKNRVILVAGDGSFQMNIQELETIKQYNLPIKIFVLNNKGYESIRATQNNLFEGNFVGADEKSGVSNPNFVFLSKAHSIKYFYIKSNNQIKKKLELILNNDENCLCEININYFQKRTPRSITIKDSSGKLKSSPLENMYPFLPEEEVKGNLYD